jgi:colicin import membrane protein
MECAHSPSRGFNRSCAFRYSARILAELAADDNAAQSDEADAKQKAADERVAKRLAEAEQAAGGNPTSLASSLLTLSTINMRERTYARTLARTETRMHESVHTCAVSRAIARLGDVQERTRYRL